MMQADTVDEIVKKLRAFPPERIAEVKDFVDFLRQRIQAQRAKPNQQASLDFPVDHLGAWPEDLSLRREDMYGDNGR